MKTQNQYKQEAAQAASVCVTVALIAAHVRSLSDEIAGMCEAKDQCEAVVTLFDALWKEADGNVKEADSALNGAIHNAVNAERKAALVNAELSEPRPSYLENCEGCLRIANDCQRELEDFFGMIGVEEGMRDLSHRHQLTNRRIGSVALWFEPLVGQDPRGFRHA